MVPNWTDWYLKKATGLETKQGRNNTVDYSIIYKRFRHRSAAECIRISFGSVTTYLIVTSPQK